MSTLGSKYGLCEAVPCENKDYVDRSLYLDDATILLESINPRILQGLLRKEMEVLTKTGVDENSTPFDFAMQAEKLYKLARIYAQIDQLKNQIK